MTPPNDKSDMPYEYYLISKGLYFRPNACGYTGIRDEAGLFNKEYAENYSRYGDPIMVHMDDDKNAPEFMPDAYTDLVVKHLKTKHEPVVAERDRWKAIAERLAGALRKVLNRVEESDNPSDCGLSITDYAVIEGLDILKSYETTAAEMEGV